MAETISDTQTRLETFVKEQSPDLDVAPGTVISELVIKQNTILQNPIINNMLDLSQAAAVSTVIASTTETFSPVIDAIASNYNTSRGAGKKSTGKIKVIVARNSQYYLNKGFKFYQPVLNLNYVVDAAYTAKLGGTGTSELPLVSDNGQYYFVVPVSAENAGAEYQVSGNTKFSVSTDNPLSSFVDALAYGNFTTGLPVDNDKALIAKYQTGIANKSLLTQKSIVSRLQELYPNVRDISVIGANDEEMSRSKHNAFGLSILGMTDVYVRSSVGPETIQITKTATNVDTTWSFTIDAGDVPGFYRIISILPSGEGYTGTFIPTEEFDFSTAGIEPANSLTTLQEARFTKYQSCDVTFEYDGPAGPKDFDVTVAYQPNIGDIQDLFLDSEERITCADYLVKATIPCYVTVALRVHRKNGTDTIPTELIKQDIYNYINTIPFGQDLHVSQLIEICHQYDIKYVEFPISITGTIYTAAGTTIEISGSEKLSIPKNLDVGVSNKTTTFFADYYKPGGVENLMSESISVTVV